MREPEDAATIEEMGRRNRNPVRSLVESKILWKYIALILAIAILAAYLANGFEGAFDPEQMANGLLYSSVTALIVSMFYDIGTRRDLALAVQSERDYLRQELGPRLLGLMDFRKLTAAEVSTVASHISADERLMAEVSRSLLGTVDGSSFYYTWLKPLVDGAVLQDVEVVNRLKRVTARTDVYDLDLRLRFSPPASKRAFVVVITDNNDLYNSFLTSSVAVDELVGTSTEEWASIDEQAASLSLRAYRTRRGEREVVSVRRETLPSSALSARLGREITTDRVRAFSFPLADPSEGWRYEYSHVIRNRVSDPYYYWTAVRPMSITHITMHYGDAMPVLGRVSANSLLGSSENAPEHDRKAGHYSITINSLVWPGQGALLIWRPPCSH